MRGISKFMVARYVRDCLRREDVPRVSELASEYGLTPEYVSRSFRDRFGVRISDYMKAIQVRAAQHLLRTTDLNTTRIAYRCGFGTRRSFFRTYRRMAGTSPVEDARR
ncbi:MAG TPA: helix-turn-helix domain-containing protein [Thermoanaerobaculia bacterium]|jgi:transcriptional regulator GlxA family with amidase domain|nr:helix-turn-helix domain-containing protein [Thermoanaerobaculia bacterium]